MGQKDLSGPFVKVGTEREKEQRRLKLKAIVSVQVLAEGLEGLEVINIEG